MVKLAPCVGLLCLCQSIQPLVAQSSLVLSPTGAPSGSTGALSLTLSSLAGNEPGALQWTLSYPSGITAFSVSAGPALLAASKSIDCAGNATAYICLATGLNSNTIGDGVVATISFNLSGTDTDFSVAISNAVAASPTGSSMPISTTAPSVPANLTATAASATAINIAWTASTDTIGVAGYNVYRGGSQIAVVTSGTSYQDTGLTPLTSYSYTVAAYDAVGNLSAQSAAAAATTQNAMTGPSIPANVTATAASATAINVAWSASTDNIGVAGYNVYRGNSQIAVVTSGTSYQDTGLTPSTTYVYTVAAYDAAGNLSALSAAAAATTQKDTTPPSVPANVTATAASSTAINLAWGASTDNVGVAGYKVYRGNSQIAVVTSGTSYQDTGLTASTTYVYTVAAYDAAGNLSAQSAAATATTQKGTIVQSIPVNVTATAASATAINLAWSAPLSYALVAGYNVYRGGSQIAVVVASGTSGTSYQDTGLTPSTTYSYTVAAYDLAGNLSAQSAAATATTQAGSSASISRLQFKAGSVSYGSSLTITLPNATIPGNELMVAVSDYYASASDGASFSIADSYQNTWHTAVDYQPAGRLIVYYAENIAGGSNHQITIRSAGAGAGNPTYYIATALEYAGLAKTNSLDTFVTNRATSSLYTSTPATTSQAAELLLGLHHVWNTNTTFAPSGGWNQIETTITSFDEQTTQDQVVNSIGSYASTGMESPAAADTLSVMVAFRGSTGPSVPANVTATAASATAMNIAWSASIDSAGVAGYKVYRGGGQIAVVVTSGTSGTSYQDIGLTPSTAYSYTLAAYDAAGISSAQSAAATASTQNDTTPPSVPANLTATAASATAINLAWSASTDNVGVAGYKVYRGGSQIAVVTSGTSYQDTGLTPSTAYSYTVAAYDAAGNLSAQSAAATASTQKDTTAPSVPANVTATAASSTAINLAWSASTDNVGVAGYKVYRGGSQIAAVTSGTSYQDTGLTPSTTYSYTVAAYDAAGNLSAQSAAATATTQAGSSASISRLQFKAGSVSYGSSLTITLPNATIPGNELMVAVSDYYASASDGASFSIADSYQNTWHTAVDYQPAGRLIVYYAENIAGGSNHQITIRSAGAGSSNPTYYIATALEYAGLAKTNSLDAFVTNRATSSLYTSTPATTSQAAELLLGLHHVWNTNTTFVPSSGWNQIETTITSFDEHATQDRVVNSIGSYASTGMESPAAADTLSVMVAFRGSTAPVTTAPSVLTIPAIQAPASSAAAPPLLLVNGDASELDGTGNGATVTPSIAPVGLTGALVVQGTGSLNFAPAQSGGGVYFLKCCDNFSNAYYKFNGTPVGAVFNTSQGQISFYLKSRYSFAQRQASGPARFAFDVRDQDPNNHLYYFNTQAPDGNLVFSYSVNNVPQFYYVPKGTEDALLGAGVALKVTISWDGSNIKLYLNDGLAQSTPYTKPSPNWTAASTFDIGAYEYLNLGGFNACDDVIEGFSVTAIMHP